MYVHTYTYVYTHARPSERCTPTRMCVCARVRAIRSVSKEIVSVKRDLVQCCCRPASLCLSLTVSVSVTHTLSRIQQQQQCQNKRMNGTHARARSQDTCTRASSLPSPSTIPTHPSSLPHSRSACVCLSVDGNSQRDLRWPRQQVRERAR